MTHQGWVRAVVFSPDGKTVLTGSLDKTARLWNAADGQPRPAHGASGQGHGRGVQPRWQDRPHREPRQDRAALERLRQRTPRPAHGASGLDLGRGVQPRRQDRPHWELGTARLWNAADGAPRGQPMVHPASVSVYAVAFSPDGKTVLTGSGNYTARLWNVADGATRGQPMVHEGSVVAVAFSPDGKAVLTGSGDHTARLWNASDGTPLGLPMVHQGAVIAVAFSPDGKTVLTGSDDHTARLWNVADGAPAACPWCIRARSWPWRSAPTARPSSPGATTTPRGSGTPPTARPRPAHGASGQGQGRGVQPRRQDRPHRERRQDRAALERRRRHARGLPMVHQDPVRAVAFSPDGKTVLTGSGDNTARLWNAADGAPAACPWCIRTRSVPWRSAPTARPSSPGAGTPPRGSGTPPTARTRGLPMVHQDKVRAVAFSPDGKTVLTGSSGTTRLWSAANGAPRGLPMVHQDKVRAVAFSLDGKTVLTGSGDKTTRLWNAADSAAPRPAHGASGLGRGRGVQPRWQYRPHRERRPHRATLERRRRRTPSASPWCIRAPS